jgi:xylulokinase
MGGRALFLGFDVGTHGTKGLAIDAERGEVIARGSSSYGLIDGLPVGHAEQHPDTWAQALRNVTAQLLASERVDASAIAAIGVSGQQHGLVVLDEHGEVVRAAKLWCDTSTADEARDLSRELGRSVPAGFTASKIVWLKRREPEHWNATRHVLLPHDWVNFRLTGVLAMEAGDASGTGFFDVRERRFDPRALRAIDPRLEALLPELVGAGEPIGELTPVGARWLGLPESAAGALVASGGGDNMLSAIGAGATRPGIAVLSLGTSATVFGSSAKPVIDPEGAIAPFCDSTGAWLPLLCVMNATGVLEEVRACFDASFDELALAAIGVDPGSDGLLFLPYLQGERVPDLPRASGSLLGLRPGSLRRGHLFRAALEGTSLNLAWGVERLRALGLAVDSIRAVGGGARNDLWLAILADCLRAPITRLVESESAALGAALQAQWTARRAAGERISADEVAAPWIHSESTAFEPDAQRSEHYARLLARFRESCTRLQESPAESG